MKIKSTPTLLLLALFCFSSFYIKAQKAGGNIVPKPVSTTPLKGQFELQSASGIAALDSGSTKVALLFKDFLKDNFDLDKEVHSTNGNIRFSLDSDIVSQKEGYQLTVTPEELILTGKDEAGLFYGLQSILQLLPTSKQVDYSVPAVKITDFPRNGYRGMHLDCGRYYFPVSFIKEYLDMMARYKFNTFHWHLTEDAGWRIEIKKYPRLTEIGSKRKQTIVGHAGRSDEFDGKPYEGFYTQEEARDIVAYAKDRQITVIPEIEIPGHATAALASYPLLGCTNGPYEVQTKWGITSDIFCAGKEITFQFLEDVFTEVMELFPSHYIHIGGDEARKDQWKICPLCQKRIKEENLKDEEGLQSYFIGRIEKFLNSHDRDIIGWDEILEGGLAPNATVMSWRGEAGGIEAARQNHHVIMTPNIYAYLDYSPSDNPNEPLNIGGYLPLSKVYSYNPAPEELTEDQKKHIIGVQANLWSEYIATSEKAEYMLMPRMLAMSEVAWTPQEERKYTDFLDRLPAQLHYLDQQRVKFRIPEPKGLKSDTTKQSKVTVDLTSYVPGSKIFYTLDGSEPTESSTLYEKPFKLNLKKNPRTTLRLIEVTPNQNKSIVYEAHYVRE